MFPAFAIYRGRQCRVLDYLGGGVFRLLDGGTVRVLHRSRFTFVRSSERIGG